MTDTYINLVNKVLKPFNEVQLTVSNFASVEDGFHQHAKDMVNSAIYDICIYEDTLWPFLWATDSITTLTDGTIEYDLNTNAAAIKWNSFRVLKNTPNNINALKVNEQGYDVYRKTQWEFDANAESTEYGPPRIIVRTPNNKVIVSPPSDKAYEIEYEYYTFPALLVNSSDTTIIPLAYNQLITDRALQYLHHFRGDYEASQLCERRFTDNLSNMRRILIGRSNVMIPIN